MLTNAARKRRLLIMFILTFTYMIAELVVGYWGKSTTLLTDAFHMLSDVIALVIGFTAIHLSPKKWDKNTFGWARMEVLGALVNAIFLLALCFTIVMDSIQKIANPKPLEELVLILAVGGGGLLLNLIGLFIFHESKPKETADVTEEIDSDRGSLIQNQNRLTRIIVPKIAASIAPASDDKGSVGNVSNSTPFKDTTSTQARSSRKTFSAEKLEKVDVEAPPAKKATAIRKPKQNINMRSVFLHLMADTANSVVVMIAAGTTFAVQKNVGEDYDKFPKWKWVNYLDPILSIIIVCLICLSTWPLIQETSLILLQTVPSHVSMKVLTEELLAEVKGVSGIHEFHVWQLAGDKFYASIHVKCATLSDYERIANEIKLFFNRRGIYETTIQAEIKALDLEGKGSESCLVLPVESKSTASPPVKQSLAKTTN